MKKNKLLLLIIPLVVIAVILLGVAGALLIGHNTDDEYDVLLSQAQAAFESGDYDSAIDVYIQAITLDDQRAEAYEGLINLYIEAKSPNNAQYIADEYQNRTGLALETHYTEAIQQAFDDLEAEQEAEEEAETDKEVTELTEKVTLNSELLSFIAGATFADYNSRYGEPIIDNQGETSYVTYASVPIECTYGTVDGSINVDSSGKPYSESRPISIALKDLSGLLVGMTGPVPLDVLKQESDLAGLTIQGSTGSNYLAGNIGGCQVKISCDENGQIPGTDAWNEITIVQVAEEVSVCSVAGSVINAVTNSGVSDARMIFREGLNTTDGPAVKEMDATAGGDYVIELEPGDYTVEISAPGFITEFFELEIHSWYTSEKFDFVISPELAAGEIRIVLEWGNFPNDLDSHLEGYSSAGDHIKVDYTNRNVDGVANLDVDDMDGYGPETTTITDVHGSYMFWVEDYGNTGMMAMSGAVVKIYTPDQSEPIILEVPANAVNTWEICTIQDGVVTVINSGK